MDCAMNYSFDNLDMSYVKNNGLYLEFECCLPEIV